MGMANGKKASRYSFSSFLSVIKIDSMKKIPALHYLAFPVLRFQYFLKRFSESLAASRENELFKNSFAFVS